MESIEGLGQGTQIVATQIGRLATSLPGQPQTPLSLPCFPGSSGLMAKFLCGGCEFQGWGWSPSLNPEPPPHLLFWVPLGSVTTGGVGRACSAPWPSDKTGLSPAQTEVRVWGWALCTWGPEGQACHASLRGDSEVMPSRDMGPPDGTAYLHPRRSPLRPWAHKPDQSHGVNSAVGASLTRGRREIQSGL